MQPFQHLNDPLAELPAALTEMQRVVEPPTPPPSEQYSRNLEQQTIRVIEAYNYIPLTSMHFYILSLIVMLANCM